ncbi:MAG: trypsin-like peptidase domain-containing protein [Pirellulales bacterium]|nr:trypsin-like peptidase domain-containing protein [Pirellulales bacterium]
MVSLQAALAALVLSSTSQTVLLDFYADWCAPCRAMNPTVEALAEQGYPVRRVNIDRDRQLAAKYGVKNIPCFVMLVGGQEVDRVVGGTSFSRLEAMCKMGAAAPPAAESPPPQTLDSAPPPIQTLPQANGPPTVEASDASRWRGQQPSNILPEAREPRLQPPPGNDPADAALLAASVRLRIEDVNGHSCGSGTIVDARDGEALVLTCGHIFRELKENGRIEVDLFGAGGPQRVPGKLISYDIDRDVGLVAIRPQGPVSAARIAPEEYHVRAGMSVVSVGCDNGADPTARRSRITSLDKYLGPPNIQVAGQPVEGRSGGGLFSGEGYLIGVCNAADPRDGEGLFAAPATIRAQLDAAQLAFIYRPPAVVPASAVEATEPVALAAVAPPPLPERMPGGHNPPAAAAPGELTPPERAALDEIRRRLREGAEVICVIRPRNDPTAKSEVIVLDRASIAFLERLAAERRLTSFKTPRPSKKLLEWSAAEGTTVDDLPPEMKNAGGR